jgi:predicted transcriptional regulator
MMPYGELPVRRAAGALRLSIVLRSRFGVSFEQAANRLTMLQRPGASGVPFFMLEVDNAGHRFRKAGARAFRKAASAAVSKARCTRPSPSRARFLSRRSKCPTAPSS